MWTGGVLWRLGVLWAGLGVGETERRAWVAARRFSRSVTSPSTPLLTPSSSLLCCAFATSTIVCPRLSDVSAVSVGADVSL